ncbi:MAG: elongation factor P [Phycisphaeraceae bacterium]|nr:elongation factor P [Phycisphaeraceae bacterium]MCW5762677.1 elongation factor P [Phycisphaeraceae bacterium]
MKANDLRPGMAVSVDGRLLVVVKTDHVKPGKGPAYIQAKMRDVAGAGIIEKRFGSADNVEGVILDRREMEYLFSDNDGATFMDTESFDQLTIPESILGDSLLFMVPNSTAMVLCRDGVPITMELPASVEVTVVDTPPGIKGATVTNQLKEATCDTGLKTRVPPFIEPGERIKVSTEDGSYISRVKSDD